MAETIVDPTKLKPTKVDVQVADETAQKLEQALSKKLNEQKHEEWLESGGVDSVDSDVEEFLKNK